MATFEELEIRLAAFPARLEGELRNAMTAGLLVLEADQRRHVAQDTQQLMGSISHRIEGSGLNLTGSVGPSKAYGVFVERGRRPGKYPPIAAIAGWARRHGIPPFLVARKIARRGTRAQPFVAPSLERNRDTLLRLFTRVGARMTAYVAGRA